MWERFSYYGMRALLVLYLIQYLFQGMDDGWSRDIHAFWQLTTVFKDPDLPKKLARANLRRLSFFFKAVRTPVEIRIGRLGDTPDEFSTAPLWKEHGEAEPRW